MIAASWSSVAGDVGERLVDAGGRRALERRMLVDAGGRPRPRAADHGVFGRIHGISPVDRGRFRTMTATVHEVRVVRAEDPDTQGAVGIFVEAEVHVAKTVQTIGSPGEWGIEEPDDEDYDDELTAIASDQYDVLVGVLAELGIKKVPALDKAVWVDDQDDADED